MNEKLSWILEEHYNLFHADMISRALYDDNISLTDFVNGCLLIRINEKDNGDDEFVPEEFKNV